MDSASWGMLAAAVLMVLVAIVWWRRRARNATASAAAVPGKPREKRRGPRRLNLRREGFRMGKDDNDRRGDEDRRTRKPGWDDSTGKR